MIFNIKNTIENSLKSSCGKVLILNNKIHMKLKSNQIAEHTYMHKHWAIESNWSVRNSRWHSIECILCSLKFLLTIDNRLLFSFPYNNNNKKMFFTNNKDHIECVSNCAFVEQCQSVLPRKLIAFPESHKQLASQHLIIEFN